MKTLSISGLRSHLPAVIEEVSRANESVVVTRYGKPVASIIPFRSPKAGETRYPLRGQPIQVPDDFDEPSPELWNALEVADSRGEITVARRHHPRKKMRGVGTAARRSPARKARLRRRQKG